MTDCFAKSNRRRRPNGSAITNRNSAKTTQGLLCAGLRRGRNELRSSGSLLSELKLVKCYNWSIALYGIETWTLRAVDQKQLVSSEMWCWRRMEKISWNDRVRNEVLLRVKEQRNILHEIINEG